MKNTFIYFKLVIYYFIYISYIQLQFSDLPPTTALLSSMGLSVYRNGFGGVPNAVGSISQAMRTLPSANAHLGYVVGL